MHDQWGSEGRELGKREPLENICVRVLVAVAVANGIRQG